MITVLIPAYNEQDSLAATLHSVFSNTRQPDNVVVVPNNCTDGTESVARHFPNVEVLVMENNQHKKAGALNYGLDVILPRLEDTDAVLVMDADTTLSPDFIEVAAAHLSGRVGAVGGVFEGRPSRSVLGKLQSMEFHRYGAEMPRYANRAFVLSGTGALIKAGVLRHIRTARRVGLLLPGGESYYDTVSLTEDNELTFALKVLGYDCLAPGIKTTTDVMESVRKLYHQRHRWYLGALRNLRSYGVKMPWHMRWVYWRQQLGLLISTLFMVYYVALLGLCIGLMGGIAFQPLWLIPSVVLLAERVWSVRRMGWAEKLIAALVVPEMLYSIFLNLTFLAAVKDALIGRQGSWKAT